MKIAESEATEEAYQRTSTEAEDADDISLNDLLMAVLDTGASDLHLTSGARPALRINGELIQMEEQPILTPPVIQRVMYAALTQKQREKFEENLELDFAYSVPGRARFRVNIYRQRDALGAAFRIIPFEIKKLEDLGVPPSVVELRAAGTRVRARHRSDRIGEVHDPRLTDRHGEPHAQRAHHDRRGPDRVPAPAPQVPGQPA